MADGSTPVLPHRSATRDPLTDAGPDPVDVSVGARIRQLRKWHGFSQEALAAAIGVSFQQVQKYERGANRASASMMVRIANFLGVHPGQLFDASAAQADLAPAQTPLTAFAGTPAGMDLLAAAHTLPAHAVRSLIGVARAVTLALNPADNLASSDPAARATPSEA